MVKIVTTPSEDCLLGGSFLSLSCWVLSLCFLLLVSVSVSEMMDLQPKE